MVLSRLRQALSNLSIQNKLLIINLSATATALLFAVTMVIIGEYIEERDFMMSSLQVQAKMVGENTTAAIVFNDKQGVADVLQAFAYSPDVHAAVIYDTFDNEVASYIKKGLDIKINDIKKLYRDDLSSHKNVHMHEEAAKLNNKVHIVKDIDFENETVGKLFIQADVSNLYSSILNYLLYTASVALLGLALASLLLLKLRKSITSPIYVLTGLMDTVTRENNYSIRSDNRSDDEIGMLSQYFNKMLARIQLNDEKLAHELKERYKAEEHLDKLAYYDVVTNLPNRHFFHEHLEKSVARTVTKKHKMALLFLDLDNFKVVNDTLGHKTGDILLKQAASRLSNVLRRDDYICRIGGDEFAIILENVNHSDNITSVAEKCIHALSNPFVFDDNKFYIGVSIGVSICPDDSDTANNLLVNSDIAMYDAKIRGKNNYQFFSTEMNKTYSQKYTIESELRHAIKLNQMELYYQPQFDSQGETITGVEALMRWNHPEKGLVTPDIFIPIAEETGLILPLGEWLISTACEHGNQITGCGSNDVTIAINISGIQIQDNTLVDTIKNALQNSGLNPACLEIELTESTLMENSETVINKLKQLRNLGIHIAIDDFGTGFSSMNYLKSFPINKLKIDKSFISGLPGSSEDMAITRAIIAMAHGLDIKVVAEGVEYKDQAEFLRENDCDVLQGFYFAKPMPFNDFLEQYNQQQKTANQLKLIKGSSDTGTN